jgi:hypothetical protein
VRQPTWRYSCGSTRITASAVAFSGSIDSTPVTARMPDARSITSSGSLDARRPIARDSEIKLYRPIS